MEQTTKIVEGKEYFFYDGRWRTLNKNGKVIKARGKVLEILNVGETQELKTSGLGSLIGKVTEALGIDECEGCTKRKELLNNLFPWEKCSRELTEEEKDFIKDLNNRSQMESDESRRLFELYNEITKQRVQRCMCPGLHKKMIERMMKFV